MEGSRRGSTHSCEGRLPSSSSSPPGHAGKPHFFESVAFFDGAMDATVLFARGCADRVRGGTEGGLRSRPVPGLMNE